MNDDLAFCQSKTNLKNKNTPIKILKNGILLGVFSGASELERHSEKLFGVKLLQGNISKVARGEKEQYKGFQFQFTSAPTENAKLNQAI